jgi:hypothetical protein
VQSDERLERQGLAFSDRDRMELIAWVLVLRHGPRAEGEAGERGSEI